MTSYRLYGHLKLSPRVKIFVTVLCYCCVRYFNIIHDHESRNVLINQIFTDTVNDETAKH